jgi:hypothetical protein
MNGYGAVIDPEDTNVIQVARENRERGMLMTEYGTEAMRDLIEASKTATTGGRKFDGNKPQYGLLPPKALKETVKVLTLGAQKYEPDNWKNVPDAQNRYFDALQRHLWDWKSGEKHDPETGINHLAHACCNILFLLERDSTTPEEWEELTRQK